MASEYLKWKYQDVQPRPQPEKPTKQQRLANWLHYHKWHLLAAAAAVWVAGDLLFNLVTRIEPDYQIAYVAAAPLSEEQAADWEARFACLGADCNKDGRVVVQLNQYLTQAEGGDAMYNYASNVRLTADLTACESCFFLLEDPESFQTNYEILEPGWLDMGEGLYLARRVIGADHAPAGADACDLAWQQLAKEANG